MNGQPSDSRPLRTISARLIKAGVVDLTIDFTVVGVNGPTGRDAGEPWRTEEGKQYLRGWKRNRDLWHRNLGPSGNLPQAMDPNDR